MTGEERKILHYVNDPAINRLTAPENKLHRPTINYYLALAWVLCVGIASLLISFCFVFVCKTIGFISFEINSYWYYAAIFFPFVTVLNFLILIRYIFIWFIRLYQKHALSETRLRCRFEPSCSEYAILALKKYGALRGGVKSIQRLLRCKPPWGIDYP